METREKQNLLTMIIIVAVLAIALIVGFIIYPEIKENNKTNNTQNSQSTKKSESTNTTSTNTSSTTETTTNTSSTNATSSTSTEYVGKEEENDGKAENTSLTKEERAIELAKKEWGENDTNVTYNVEQKEDNTYYVAVRINDQVQKWYEVDTEKWTIQEY